MTNTTRQKKATEIRRIMAEKKVYAKDLAKSLKVTPQTVSAIRVGTASPHLLELAIIVLDKWES
jgi:DNA-binding Xre family transcriptional regulator